MSRLDALRGQKSEEAKQNGESDWVGFLKSMVSALVLVFVWALLGSNFLYLQNYVASGERTIGALFPDNDKEPPYSGGKTTSERGDLVGQLGSKFAAMKAKLNNSRKSLTAAKQLGGDIDMKRFKMVDKISGLGSYSSPYTWKDSEPGLVGDFKAWLANSIEFSYVHGRGMLNKMFDMSNELSIGISPFLVIILCIPVMAILLHITPFYGFLSTLIGMFQAPNKGWVWALVFAFVFGIDFFVSGAVSIWQTLQLFFTFIIFPLVIDSSGVLDLMGQHYAFYTAFFGLIVVANSFRFLTLPPSIVMLLTYIYLVWKNW